MRAREPLFARLRERLLRLREASMQRQEELAEPRREIAVENETGRSDVQARTSAAPS